MSDSIIKIQTVEPSFVRYQCLWILWVTTNIDAHKLQWFYSKDRALTWAEVLKISSTVFLLRHPPAVATILAVSASFPAWPSKLRDFSAKFWSLPGVPIGNIELIKITDFLILVQIGFIPKHSQRPVGGARDLPRGTIEASLRCFRGVEMSMRSEERRVG